MNYFFTSSPNNKNKIIIVIIIIMVMIVMMMIIIIIITMMIMITITITIIIIIIIIINEISVIANTLQPPFLLSLSLSKALKHGTYSAFFCAYNVLKCKVNVFIKISNPLPFCITLREIQMKFYAIGDGNFYLIFPFSH